MGHGLGARAAKVICLSSHSGACALGMSLNAPCNISNVLITVVELCSAPVYHVNHSLLQ